MKPITDIGIARALPEKSSVGIRQVKQPDGTIERIPFFREIVAVKMSDDAILFFTDDDGRLMKVEYDIDGAYKTPHSL